MSIKALTDIPSGLDAQDYSRLMIEMARQGIAEERVFLHLILSGEAPADYLATPLGLRLSAQECRVRLAQLVCFEADIPVSLSPGSPGFDAAYFVYSRGCHG